MVEKIRYFIVFLTIILFAGIASASFSAGDPNHSIEKLYGGSQDIQGWINLSFTNEPINSLFEDSEGNSIELIDFLEKESSHIYSCDPVDCSTDYSADNGESSKTFSSDDDDSKLFGFRFTSVLESVNDVIFDIQSDAGVACESQVKVDILDDGKIDIINNKVAPAASCNLKKYGCYDLSASEKEYDLTNPFCQKISLSESPGFALGAMVKNISRTKNLEMSLYDENINKIDDCVLPDVSPGSDWQEISCDVNYSVLESEEHYVCLSPTGGTGNYRLRGNNLGPSEEGCGYPGLPPLPSTPAAYEIFAEGKGFDAVGTLNILDTLPDGNDFGILVEDYLRERYGTLDCSSECIVPIRIISGLNNQQITLKNLELTYRETGGGVTARQFWDLVEAPATVDSEYQLLSLDKAGFSVPDDLGKYEFFLEFNGEEIFSEDVTIEDVPDILSLRPLSTASAFPTEFRVKTSSGAENIENYFWDFGDGETASTSENKTTHTYSSIGTYDLRISVTDSRDFTSSETFTINVSSPKNLINETLTRMEGDLEDINNYLVDLDFFAQESLKSILDIDFVDSEVERLKAEFEDADNDTAYNWIITDLVELDFPGSIAETAIAESVPFFPDKRDIDLDILEIIGDGSYDSNIRESYLDSIIFWNQENIETRIKFTEFSGGYQTFSDPILRVFEISVSEKKDFGYDYYFILPKLDNLEIGNNVITSEEEGYVYVDLSEGGRISLSTTEDVDFANLPAFISPGINRLTIIDTKPPGDGDGGGRSKLTIFILAMSLLVVIAFISYVVLQEWYRKRYENYLFKNKNDLYNMVTYVNNAKKRGLKNKDIAQNLKKAKWSSEQIRYVMRKYAGKRTGMVELPLTGVVSKIVRGNVEKKVKPKYRHRRY
jgi:PKD repeat protein